MRHRSTITSPATPLLPVDIESRSQLTERSSTLEYQHNLAIIEEDWQNSQQQLGTPSSVSSSLFDICRCCGRQDCENLEYFNRMMKKLESDTRLAAEIGQGLLHKHETYVTESSQQRAQLEKQLEECHERMNGLEQSLDDVENEKDIVTTEKNKWLWEYQKRQKILDETISDLEMANEKYKQLSIELESKSSELEKLRIFKFMVRHSETREETLTSKLEDTNQELAVCRKNELVLESKIKKLKMRYETLYNTHEQLSRDVEEKMNATLTTVHNTNTNNIIQSDAIKVVSSNNNTNDLIHLIKELSSANTKLKSDLMNTRDQLSEARGEINSLVQKVDDNESGSSTKKISLRDDLMKKSSSTSTTIHNTNNKKKLTTRVKRAASVKERKQHQTKREVPPIPVPIKSKTAMIPLSATTPPAPAISSSMPTNTIISSSPSSVNNNPIVHHHYHYYVKNSKGERVKVTGDEMENNSNSNSSNSSHHGDLLLDCCDTTEKNDLYAAVASGSYQQQQQQLQEQQEQENMAIVLSPSTSSIITIKDGTVTTTPSMTQSPYKLLQDHVTQVLDRLRGSDIRALNRRLKRAFDITELSSMSNSVIDNILMDVDTLESRFLWLKTQEQQQQENDQHMSAFFPLLDLLKDMLKELGILRTTMNELQVEYVKKVEESEIRVEEEIIRKRQLKKPQQQNNNMNNNTTKPLTWLTNMFYKSNNNNNEYVTSSPPPPPPPSQPNDRGSTLTKTTTNCSTLITSPEEEQRSKDDEHHNRPNITRLSQTFPRQQQQQNKRNISHFPTIQQQQLQQQLQQPIPSNSNSTSRSSPSIPIRKKRSSHRMHIDYEGVGPASIRPIVHSDRDHPVVSFSSSWLGGK